jgi:hypothetical protein
MLTLFFLLIYCACGFWLLELTNLSFLQTVEEVLPLERKIVNIATLSDPERFSEIPYSMEDASNANDCPRNAVSGAKVFYSFYLLPSLCYAVISYFYWKIWC